MNKVGAKAYLVNTGWNGSGKRISIKDTRGIIDAILDGSIDKAPTKVIPYFDFVVPTELPGVDPKILDPRDTYECAASGKKKQKTWLDVSSRTSLSSQVTKQVRLWLLLVRNSNLNLQIITYLKRLRSRKPLFVSFEEARFVADQT